MNSSSPLVAFRRRIAGFSSSAGLRAIEENNPCSPLFPRTEMANVSPHFPRYLKSPLVAL